MPTAWYSQEGNTLINLHSGDNKCLKPTNQWDVFPNKGEVCQANN